MPVILSLSPKSATTPIAIEVSRMVGGIPALSAIIVILTGIFGAAFGMMFLRLFGVKRPIAQGLAMGAAAHAVGTSQAMLRSRRLGAYSSIGLILNGHIDGFCSHRICFSFWDTADGRRHVHDVMPLATCLNEVLG